jgi:hypothetical protein
VERVEPPRPGVDDRRVRDVDPERLADDRRVAVDEPVLALGDLAAAGPFAPAVAVEAALFGAEAPDGVLAFPSALASVARASPIMIVRASTLACARSRLSFASAKRASSFSRLRRNRLGVAGAALGRDRSFFAIRVPSLPPLVDRSACRRTTPSRGRAHRCTRDPVHALSTSSQRRRVSTRCPG